MSGTKRLPNADFNRRTISFAPSPPERFFRVYRSAFPDPLGYKPVPSRFSDPEIGKLGAKPYGTIYFGESIEVCVLETLIWDTGDGRAGQSIPLRESDLAALSVANVGFKIPLRLLDLQSGGSLKLGMPTDAIRASDHALGQAWSQAIHDHPSEPDGILFSSRLNEQTNAAIFDRALEKLEVEYTRPLLDHQNELG